MKRLDRKWLAVLAATTAVVVIAAGAGIARAVSGSDESLSGPTAAKAKAAAVVAVGGGTALEAERQDDPDAGVYEVKVQRKDGSKVDVYLDARFESVGTVAEDDQGGADEQDGESD